MPEKALQRLNKFEKEAATVIKDIALDLLRESCDEAADETKKEIKKVKVDFL